jgi:hypothetical protein
MNKRKKIHFLPVNVENAECVHQVEYGIESDFKRPLSCEYEHTTQGPFVSCSPCENKIKWQCIFTPSKKRRFCREAGEDPMQSPVIKLNNLTYCNMFYIGR